MSLGGSGGGAEARIKGAATKIKEAAITRLSLLPSFSLEVTRPCQGQGEVRTVRIEDGSGSGQVRILGWLMGQDLR